MTSAPSRRGLTALEVLVPAAIFSLVGAAWWALESGAAARYAAPESSAAAREQARRALNEMADELRLAAQDSITIDPRPSGARLRFNTRAGSAITYAEEPSRDAARLVRIQDGQSVTLVDGLRPGGFSARKDASILTLALSPRMDTPLQTAVALR